MYIHTLTFREEYGSRILSLEGHRGEVFMSVWNPTQPQLASGSADGICRLWTLNNITTSSIISSSSGNISVPTAILPHIQLVGEKYKDVTSITWSPDGQFLATGCYDGMVSTISSRLDMLYANAIVHRPASGRPRGRWSESCRSTLDQSSA
jgi:WD40 repeat protein